MNKYRTHNCSELSIKEINKIVHFWMVTQKKRSWKFIIHRFKRSLWNNTMCNRK